MNKKYKVRVWCNECALCFDGSQEISEEIFDTREEAESWGEERISGCTPWDYEVIKHKKSIIKGVIK